MRSSKKRSGSNSKAVRGTKRGKFSGLLVRDSDYRPVPIDPFGDA